MKHIIARTGRTYICIGLLLIAAVTLMAGCSKSYLEAKPDKALVLPDNLQALQAVLDNTDIFNAGWPSAGEIGSDNLYITDAAWENLNTDITSRDLYTWGNNVFNDGIDNEWFLMYKIVFESNVVLENVDNIILGAGETEKDRANVKGQALFFRAAAFYELAQLFTLPYDSLSADKTAGIPLKLSADINSATTRSTMAETYAQVLKDLEATVHLLPVTPKYLTRPSLPATYGELARVYLAMQQYHNAGVYADSCLQLKSDLLDFNTLNPADYNPVPAFNKEVIVHLQQFARSILSDPYGNVDSNLYASYDSNDLRKAIFFKPNSSGSGGMCFYGSYTGNYYQFNGIATDEMLLVRAETEARENNTAEAVKDLNTLLQNRYVTNTFVPWSISNSKQALDTILSERRKELVFRGQRWGDLRRLNKEDAYAVTVKRKIEGADYLLLPGDKKYALLIPQAAIASSGIEQNPR